MKAPTILTERFVIRSFEKADAELWQKWDTDPEVQAYMPEPMNQSQDIAHQYEYIRECEEEEDGYYWSIESMQGVTVGTIALTDIDTHHKTAEIGVVIGDKQFWRKGVATEVLAALVSFAFNSLDIERISAEAEAENTGVAKALLKTGFTQDGVFLAARVKNGYRISVTHFGILKSSQS
jgi:ribosomal-protein-alanine N-acetyltransferase